MIDNTKAKKSLSSKIFNETIRLIVFSIVLGLVVGAIILKISGFSILEAYGLMFKGMLGSPKNIAWTIVYATPLILTGLSVAFAFRTGLFNIGVEGQFIIGSIGAFIVGYFVQLPAIIHIPLTFLAGVIAAGLWGGLAGLLKSKFGVHEVIATIMLNWIALYLNNYIMELPLIKRPNSESSHRIQETARIGITWFKDIVGPAVKLNWGTIVGIIIAIIISYVLFKTTLGYRLRAVGFNRDAAEYGGINVNRSIVTSMFIAGMLGGAAGALHIMGNYFQISVLAAMEGFGLNGIAVALIANNSPIGTIFAALLFGGISYGGRNMQSASVPVPTEVINIVIGSIIFFIATHNLIMYLEKKGISVFNKIGLVRKKGDKAND